MVTDRKCRTATHGASRIRQGEVLSRFRLESLTRKIQRRKGSPVDKLHVASACLSRQYGDPRHHNKSDPLDELIFIILSAKTVEASYLRTYDALKNAFGDWFCILDAPRGSVADIISSGGLSEKKEVQIRALLNDIEERTGAKGLNMLSRMSTKEAEEFLTSLPGVGLKTARCVLMYSLDRDVFPVDTHVRRVLSRLGIIRFERLSDKVQNSIQKRVPSEIRYKLHVNLVAHGRAICRARNPLCNSCVVSDICKYFADHLFSMAAQ